MLVINLQLSYSKSTYVPIERFLKQAILAAGGGWGWIMRATSNRQDRYLHHVKMCVCGDRGRSGGWGGAGLVSGLLYTIYCVRVS